MRRALYPIPVLYLVVAVVTATTGLALKYLGIPPVGSPIIHQLLHSPSPALWGSVAILAVVVAPIAEELLFRLVLYEALRPYSERLATILTAMSFAALHRAPAEFPGLFILGLVLQHTRRKSGSLWAAILLHSAFNATSLVIVAAFKLTP